MPEARFRHIHLDIVGPLPPSNTFTHILTCIDRFTRWPTAIPLRGTSSESVAKALVESWISIFGVPSTITTDRGSQFTSALFRELSQLLGSTHIRTTAYHPAANGMVERFHRHLKSSIIATSSRLHWSERLPIILLAIRNTIKEDLGCCPAELVFGATLRLLGEMILDSKERENPDPLSYATRLKDHFRSIRPIPTRQNDRTEQIHKDLSTCPFVFVRVDAVRKPLQPPYDGPFLVLERKPKYFILDRSGTKDSVSIDRLKPAYLELPDVNLNSALPKLSPFVSPDNVHTSNTRAQSSCEDVIQPFTPSFQDTVQSTTSPPCMSRNELSRTLSNSLRPKS